MLRHFSIKVEPRSSWKLELVFRANIVYLGGFTSVGDFPDSSVGKESTCSCWRPQFYSWVGTIHCRRDRLPTPVFLGFPCGSTGKESACNSGDLGSSLGWEVPLEKGNVTHSSILAYRIPRTTCVCIVHEVTELDTTEQLWLCLCLFVTSVRCFCEQ